MRARPVKQTHGGLIRMTSAADLFIKVVSAPVTSSVA
jgi:hypothetical protein